MNSIKKIFIITLLLSFGILSLTGICFAKDNAAKQIQEEPTGPKHYPKEFSGTGPVDRISKHEIVIGDSLFKLSPLVTYSTPERRHATKAYVKVGSYIGFVTGSDKHEIISIWLLK
jgi:hypothetical protein